MSKTIGYIDRIEEGKAVIIVEEIKKEFVIDKKDINPSIKEGDWLQIELNEGQIEWINKDDSLTDENRKRIKGKADKVRKKSKGSKYKKK